MNSKEITDIVRPVLATLAVASQVLLGLTMLLALVSLVWAPARRLLADLRDTLGPGALWLAWTVAAVATLGSLFFSEISHFIPCRLCWFQRIAMYPLFVVLLVGALRRDVRAAFWYAIVFPVVGAGVSVYHLYIEAHPEAESKSCIIGVPCSTKWIDEFGYVTMPMLALTAFASVFALLVLARSWAGAEARGESEHTPDGMPALDASSRPDPVV